MKTLIIIITILFGLDAYAVLWWPRYGFQVSRYFGRTSRFLSWTGWLFGPLTVCEGWRWAVYMVLHAWCTWYRQCFHRKIYHEFHVFEWMIFVWNWQIRVMRPLEASLYPANFPWVTFLINYVVINYKEAFLLPIPIVDGEQSLFSFRFSEGSARANVDMLE